MSTTGYRCNNCIAEVYMDDLGDGFYRCPVCGDEFDERYQFDDPFEETEFEELQGDIDDFGPQYFDSHQDHNGLVE